MEIKPVCRTLIIVLLLLACLVYIILLSEIGAIARENLHGSIFDIQETTIRVNSSASYKIPKVCYQTWVTKDLNKLSNSTRSTILSNQKLNPDIKFVLWDDGDVDRFMRTEYSGRVYQAFSTLNPKYGAARADFFRYCVLLKHGGLYLDIKSIFKVGNIFGKLILPDDICILDLRKELEPHRVQWKYGTYEQWFLVFAPGHPYLQRMIDRLVRNIEAKFEAWPVGTDALMPKESSHSKKKILRLTGPDALAVAIHDAIVDYGILHREVNYLKWVKYSREVIGNPEYEHLNLTHYQMMDGVPLFVNLTDS